MLCICIPISGVWTSNISHHQLQYALVNGLFTYLCQVSYPRSKFYFRHFCFSQLDPSRFEANFRLIYKKSINLNSKEDD